MVIVTVITFLTRIVATLEAYEDEQIICRKENRALVKGRHTAISSLDGRIDTNASFPTDPL